MSILSNSQWVDDFDEKHLVLYDGTMEYTNSDYIAQENMLFSVYARDDGNYDFEITYEDGSSETYILICDFSYDDYGYLHYEFASYMELQCSH